MDNVALDGRSCRGWGDSFRVRRGTRHSEGQGSNVLCCPIWMSVGTMSLLECHGKRRAHVPRVMERTEKPMQEGNYCPEMAHTAV